METINSLAKAGLFGGSVLVWSAPSFAKSYSMKNLLNDKAHAVLKTVKTFL